MKWRTRDDARQHIVYKHEMIKLQELIYLTIRMILVVWNLSKLQRLLLFLRLEFKVFETIDLEFTDFTSMVRHHGGNSGSLCGSATNVWLNPLRCRRVVACL